VSLALIAVLMPFETMAAIHGRLGLGGLPDLPLVDYLARSLSLFYAVLAPLYFLVAARLRELRAIAVYLGWLHVTLGVAAFAIDLHAGLPAFWTWSEGPQTLVVGVLILALLRRIPGTSS
jgi:hypothetical protein